MFHVRSFPKSSQSQFMSELESILERFPTNDACRLIDEQKFSMDDYHWILNTIFHQVFTGPTTFAIAATNTHPSQTIIRDYLIQHADEEKTHWTWILNDLKATGFKGPDPLDTPPALHTLNYINLNYFVANFYPESRLGIACLLESIGATFSKKYATRLVELLKLDATNASFFFGHGDTDVGHTQEIFEVLEKSKIDDSKWSEMTYFLKASADLYYRMYMKG